MRERGGIISGILALALVQCGGLRETQLAADNGDDCGRGGYCSGEDNRGDCRNTDQPCSDDDFSPRFDDSPVDHSFNFGPVCVMPGSCTGQPDQQPPK